MRYTHAVVIRIPQSVKFESKKQEKKVDLSVARKQQEDLNDTLREVSFKHLNVGSFLYFKAGLDVIELQPEEQTNLVNLFTDDALISKLISSISNEYICFDTEVLDN